MSSAHIAHALMLVVCMGAVALIGCEGDQGPTGPVGPIGPTGIPGPLKLSVVASIMVAPVFKTDVDASFAMSVYNAPSIPRVWFDDTIIPYSASDLSEDGRLAYFDNVMVNDTDIAVLELTYTKEDGTAGAASSTISLPGQFGVIAPTVAVPLGGDFEGVWELSDGADAYWIFQHWHLEYIDTGGVARTIHRSAESVQSPNDTMLTVAWSANFPDSSEIGSISLLYANIWIRAVTGPWLPGQANNFTGDAVGLFVGVTANRFIDVSLADTETISTNPKVGTSTQAVDAVDDCFNRRLQIMARQQTGLKP